MTDPAERKWSEHHVPLLDLGFVAELDILVSESGTDKERDAIPADATVAIDASCLIPGSVDWEAQ